MVKADELTREEADSLLPQGQADENSSKRMKTAPLKCPVMTSRDAKREFSTSYEGGNVYFCCKNCLAKFKANPKKYHAAAQQQMALAGQARGKGER